MPDEKISALVYSPEQAYAVYRAKMLQRGVVVEETWDMLTDIDQSAWTAVVRDFMIVAHKQVIEIMLEVKNGK